MTTTQTTGMTPTTILRLKKILPILIADDIPIMLHGPMGIGKTEIADEVAEEMKLPLIDWRTNLRDPVDARGIPMPNIKTRTTEWMMPSDLPFEGTSHPDKGILRLDEINTGSPQMMNVCLQLVLERRVGEHRLKKGWRIIATGNRAKDKASINRMGLPLKNRFAHFELTPDPDSFVAWGLKKGIDPRLLAFIRFTAKEGLLHMPPKDDDTHAFPTPRQWVLAAKYINQPRDIRPVLIGSLVGDTASSKLEGFLRVYHELPTAEEVMKTPSKARVPTEPAARFAVSMMVSREITRKNVNAALEYAKRLGREMEMHTVIDATTRDADLLHTSAYGKWAVENQDLLH